MDNLLKVALKSQTVPSGILCIICWLGWPIIIGILKEFQGKDRLQFNCDPKSNEYTTQLCYGNYNSDFSPLSTPLTFAGITFGVSGFGWVIVTLVNVWLLQRIRVEENNTAKEKKKGHFYWTFICHICCQLAFLVVMMGLFCRHQKREYPAEYRCFSANTTFTCNDLRYNEKSTVNIAIIVVFVLSIVFCLVAIIHLILKRKTISKHLLRNLDDTSTREERRSLDPSNNDPEKGSDNDVTADPYHKQELANTEPKTSTVNDPSFEDGASGSREEVHEREPSNAVTAEKGPSYSSEKLPDKELANTEPKTSTVNDPSFEDGASSSREEGHERAPTSPFTRAKINYFRLCRLLVDVGSQVLREKFDRIHPPESLHTVLATAPALPKLQTLQKKKVLNSLQWDKLYPVMKSSVSSKNFDITLLMVLLRSICGLTPPANGWDALPSPTDLSCEADIARIKYYRNTVYAHATQTSVDDATFDNHWMPIRDTLVRLGGADYEATIDDLKNDSLDPDTEEPLRELLRRWKTYEDSIKDKLDELNTAVNKIEVTRPTPDPFNNTPGTGDDNDAPAVQSYAQREKNYFRLYRLLVNVGSQVLRETFDKIHSPEDLETVLATPPALCLMESLQTKKILKQSQWKKLYPDVKTSVSSENFDITLLTVLLRTICGLTPPATGWDELPSPTDLSREADIARIKYYRNTVAHATQASIDDATFDNHWMDIRNALVRLGGEDYETAIDALKNDSMDPLTSGLNRKKPKSVLPKIDGNIYGRTKKIEDIVQALSGKRGEKVPGVLVSGTVGVGKSTVAIQAGHRLKEEFKTIVRFCSLRSANEGGGEDDNVLREISNVCVLGQHQGSENPRHVLLNWCVSFRNQKYELVLIVDNAEDALDDNHCLLKLLSDMRMYSDVKIKFLVTSRRSDIKTAHAPDIQFFKIPLGPLDVEESIKVLNDSTGLTSDSERDTKVKLHKIAELCENNPLALKLAGALLAEESEYELEELEQELEKNAAEALGVEKIIEITFEKLDDSLKHTLLLLSVFPRYFKRDAAKAILVDNPAKHLTKLKQRCLIQRQGNRYLIHLLIRSHIKKIGRIRGQLRSVLTEGKQRFLRHFLSLILKNAKIYWEKDTCGKSFTLFNEERINLESTLREIAGKEIRDCSEMEDLMNECQQVAPYIEYCVHFQLYEEFLIGLHKLCKSQGKPTKEVEILCLRYHEKRKYSCNYEQNSKDFILDAKKLHDYNLSLFTQNRLSEACYLNHYGRYLSEDCNEREQAKPLLKEAISIYEERNSAFDIGRIYVQLGHNLKHEKRCEEALDSYTEALRFRTFHYGKHFLTAFAHKDVADCYLMLENFIKAEESYEKAIQLLEHIEMVERKEAVSVLGNYGKCLAKREKIKKARRVLEKARHVAANTILGSVRVKVEVNTSLALLLYNKYPDEENNPDQLSREVFDMSKVLKIDKWPESTELETFYRRKWTCG